MSIFKFLNVLEIRSDEFSNILFFFFRNFSLWDCFLSFGHHPYIRYSYFLYIIFIFHFIVRYYLVLYFNKEPFLFIFFSIYSSNIYKIRRNMDKKKKGSEEIGCCFFFIIKLPPKKYFIIGHRLIIFIFGGFQVG